MLSINLTLFAQIIHFLIAWFLFDRLFLQAAYAFIMHKKNLQRTIEEQHATMRTHVEDKKKWYHELYSEHGRSLFSSLPGLQKTSLNFLRKMPKTSIELSEPQKRELLTLYTQRIEQSLAKDKL